MKKMTKIFTLAIVMLAFSAATFAQATALASATIVTPISITWVSDMNFGNILAGVAAGTVALPAAAAPVRVATNCTLPAVTGTVTAASFTVAGQNGLSYLVTLPASVSLTGPGPAMTAATFLTNKPANIGTIDASTLYVGATLSVGTAALQTAGAYTSAAFTVTVNYQ